jgi:hypothetical protein
MNALLRALEEREYKVEVTRALSYEERQRQDRHDREVPDNATRVLVGEEWIEFGIFEKSRIVRESAEQPKGLKGNALESWLLSDHTTTRYVQDGSLELKITKPDFLGTRTTWGDGKRQRVEDCLGAFVVYLPVVADAKRQHRLELEHRHRKWEEERRREEEARARAREEAEREKRFEEDLRDWRQARDAREYAAEIRRLLSKNQLAADTGLVESLEWMDAYAERTDPLTPIRAAARGSLQQQMTESGEEQGPEE